MHYDVVQRKFGQFPSVFAIGPNDTGKTTAAKAFLSLVGGEEKALVRQLTLAEAGLRCSVSTVPFVFDDPDKMEDVRVLVNNNFNGQVRATTQTTNIPKTTCLFTLNEQKLPRLLTSFRYVIIRFNVVNMLFIVLKYYVL